MAKYHVRFYRTYMNRREDYAKVGTADTLDQAKELRCVSGDIVTDCGGNVITDDTWLWEWEKRESSYAARLIRREREINVSNTHRGKDR